MDLKDEIGEKATVINEELKKSLAFKGLKIYDAMRHLILGGGKRLRPVIALLSCEAVGGKNIETATLFIKNTFFTNGIQNRC